MLLEVIISIIGICFILLYFVFKLDNTHTIWTYLTCMFVIALLLTIPKALLDYRTTAPITQRNETVTGNVTMAYETVVYPESIITSSSNMLSYMIKYLIAFATYIFIYINWWWWIKNKFTQLGWVDGKK